MTVLADTAAWLGAGAGVIGAVAAVLGLFAVFKWFRPKFRARSDDRRQAIRLDVVNDGRAAGCIRKAAPVDEQLGELNARYAGLNDGRFHAAEVPARSTQLLIIEALPETGEFPSGTRVLVAWGRRKQRVLDLEPSDGVSYYGMGSDWPE